MSWQGQTILLLRDLVNDTTEGSYTYTDARLEQSIVSASFFLSRQVSFSQSYVINVETCSITPDPSTDYDFLALAALKSAVMILSSELKTYALTSARVTDGPSTIDMTATALHIKELLKNAQDQFERAKLAHQIGNGGYGKAVFGPMSPASDSFRPDYSYFRR